MTTTEHYCLPELIKYADAAYGNRAAIQNTYDLTKRVIDDDIPGILVECGVAAGAQIGVIGHCLGQYNADVEAERAIFAFDSFCGIPLAGPNDNDQPGIGYIDPNRPIPDDLRELLKTSGVAAHSLENVCNNLFVAWGLSRERYRFFEGWFQDTIPVAAPQIGKIALLRLDGDLYESTKICLEHLFPKVQPGGYVIIDDYALKGCSQAVKEYLAAQGLSPELIPVVPEVPEVHYFRV